VTPSERETGPCEIPAERQELARLDELFARFGGAVPGLAAATPSRGIYAARAAPGMERPFVLDSTVLIAFCDCRHPLHAQAASDLRYHRGCGHPLAVPASVLADVFAGAIRIGTHAVASLGDLLDGLIDVVPPINRETACHAAVYRNAHDVPLHAALVLGTADAIDADGILTTDQTWRQFDRRVGIIGVDFV
jgi:hypothetical protein